MNNEYITIKEFAERAGVSTQAIYQRLNKDLQVYLQVENGKKRLNIAALQLFNASELKQVDCKENTNLQSDFLIKTLEVLREQLAEKDKQLEAAAAEKAELLARLKDAQQAEQQAHLLHAGTMQQTALIESRPAENSAVERRTAEPAETKKRGWKFWQR